MIKVMVEQSMKNTGLSTIDIAFAMLTAVILLGSLFSFIFLALQGWYSNSSFNSIVQTTLVSLSGKVATSVRRRSAAENGDINSIMAEVSGSDGGDAGSGDAGGGGGG